MKKNQKLFLILFISFSAYQISYSQVSQEWVRRYNGPGNFQDIPYAMTLDASGNIYITGTSFSNSTIFDIATVKYNSAGEQQWVQRYNEGTEDAAFSIAVDGTGNVYITGSIQGSNGFDYATIKYNSAGVQQWAQIYDGPTFDDDEARSVAVDASGNVYVTGYSTGIGTGTDYATIKYSSDGAELWVQRFDNGNAQDTAVQLALDGSGNVYVTGGSNTDYKTIKYNPSGVHQWIQTYNGPGNGKDTPSAIEIDEAENIYITGMSVGSGTNFDYATIKYNSSGVQQWAARYNGQANNYDYASSLAVDSLGNVYVTGNSFDDFATVKYNSSGIQQWVQIYNGPGNSGDYAYSIALDAANNVYVTGSSYGNATTEIDFATIKYSTSGNQEWLQRYNGSGEFYDIPVSIAIDGSGNVYVCGQSYGLGTANDYALVKYSQLVGLSPVSHDIPVQYSLSQNYPNPFNPSTKIRFDIPVPGFVQLKVFDLLGREYATLVNENLSPGTYSVMWEASDYPNGVYFYILVADYFTYTRKMVLAK